MKKEIKKLIAIQRNYEESAIFLYFEDKTYSRIDCDLSKTTNKDAIIMYGKYGAILERDQKIKEAKNLFK